MQLERARSGGVLAGGGERVVVEGAGNDDLGRARRRRSTFAAGEVSGTKIAAGCPSSPAAWATASAKLPPEAATTPAAGTSAASIALNAPRGLNEPVCWSSSSFSVIAPVEPERSGSRSSTGVSRTRPSIRAAAASISARPIGSVVGAGQLLMIEGLVEHRLVDAAARARPRAAVRPEAAASLTISAARS